MALLRIHAAIVAKGFPVGRQRVVRLMAQARDLRPPQAEIPGHDRFWSMTYRVAENVLESGLYDD